MAKWFAQVEFTGYVDVEVEADSYREAVEEAKKIANPYDVDEWCCGVEDCWCEDEEEED